MAFCNQCGGLLQQQWLSSEAHEREVCSACHTVHYDSPKVLVTCIVHWDDKLLLCQRANDPAKGRWYLPGGFVEAGESLEEAASRELHEEAGLLLPPRELSLYGLVSLTHMNQIYVSFRAQLQSAPQLHAGPEALALSFFAESEIPTVELAFNEVASAFFPEFFRRLRQRDFTVSCVTVKADRQRCRASRIEPEPPA